MTTNKFAPPQRMLPLTFAVTEQERELTATARLSLPRQQRTLTLAFAKHAQALIPSMLDEMSTSDTRPLKPVVMFGMDVNEEPDPKYSDLIDEVRLKK